MEQRLSLALERGGLTPEDAATLVALQERIQAMRFGPAARGEVSQLVAEARRVLARKATAPEPSVRRWRRRTGILTVLALAATEVQPQTQPEQYYEAGAYRAAAEGFRQRALASPSTTAHWFNLGAATYRAGDDAAALAAWVRAARLSPRDGGIRRALALVPPFDAASSAALWASPATPAELWLVGLVAWLAGWSGVVWSRRWGGRWVVLIVGGAVLIGTGHGLQRWYDRPVAIAGGNRQLRLSPHELSPAVGEVQRLGALVLGPERGQWIRVDNVGGQRGWIRRGGIEPVSGHPLE
jgi:hypothetical protein